MTLTVVMYHYVRPITCSRYPEIKGLELQKFVEQLEHLKRHYIPITIQHLQEHKKNGEALPKNSVLLTFDDGYKDHYEHVFPLLEKHGIQGAFYIPYATLVERKVLDVNKIHFILATVSEKKKLVQEIDEFLLRHSDELGKIETYREKYYHPNRWDPAEVIYIKRMLQHALPERYRMCLSDDMFRRYVTEDEGAFAEELYLNLEDTRQMLAGGMHIGSHGCQHIWLNRVKPEEQQADIQDSLKIFDACGVSAEDFTFCYPYGAYNEDSVQILQNLGCSLAFTVESRKVSNEDHPLRLPRLDTNDIHLVRH